MMSVILMFLACSTEAPSTPAELAAVADEIVTTPADADAILAKHGLDRATFEAKLYEIAEDANLSKEYLGARKH